MLTDSEKDILANIPKDKTTKILLFSNKYMDISDKIIRDINEKFPELSIRCLGSSILGIGGQGNIDIFVLSNPDLYSMYLSWLDDNYGLPEKDFEWYMSVKSVPVTIHLVDASSEEIQRYLDVHNEFAMDHDLRSRYEIMKRSHSGKSYKKYQEDKFKFFHKILNEK